MKAVNGTFKKKEVVNIPKGAKILSKNSTLTVEEIENGFLLIKNTDTKYQLNKNTDYAYSTKKWFSKENPLIIDEKKVEKKFLADNFD